MPFFVTYLWNDPLTLTVRYAHFVTFYFVYTGRQPYSCTGHFQTDFAELCRRLLPPFAYTPAVVLRPRRSRSPVPMHVVEEKATKTGKFSKKEEAEKSETPRTLDSGGCILYMFTSMK